MSCDGECKKEQSEQQEQSQMNFIPPNVIQGAIQNLFGAMDEVFQRTAVLHLQHEALVRILEEKKMIDRGRYDEIYKELIKEHNERAAEEQLKRESLAKQQASEEEIEDGIIIARDSIRKSPQGHGG